MGIEPTTSAWEAEVLPLNYIRKYYSAAFPVFKNTSLYFTTFYGFCKTYFPGYFAIPDPKRSACTTICPIFPSPAYFSKSKKFSSAEIQ